MNDGLLARYIRQLIEAHRTPEVTISWQGGEPLLMGLDFFRRSIEYAEKYRRPGMRISYTLQTNGTLIDEEWARFFRKHRMLIGISVDGPRAIHDAFRRGRKGQPSFERVMRGLGLLKKHAVEFNTLTCIHQANADRPLETYRFLRDDCGSRFIQFIPVVERVAGVHEGNQGERPGGVAAHSWQSRRDRPLYLQEGSYVTDRSVRPEQYGMFLIAVFDEWVRRDIGSVYVQLFDTALANWMKLPSGLCVHSECCGTTLALEHNGDLYSCDHFVEPRYRLGNIAESTMTELVSSPRQRKFGRDKFDTLPRYCRACRVRFACHGGCPKDRFISTSDGEAGLNYLCEGYKAFFGHIAEPMRAMVWLLAHGRAPSELMKRYRTA